jgi:hypothetical protein
MNRFMRLPELAREEVAEGLTSVRSRIPRTCAGSHRPASREANPSSSRFIKTTAQDTPREKACLLARSRGAGIAAEYQSPRGYMRVDCGERHFFAFPSRFGRRRSDRFAISFADNLRNLLAGSFPGRAPQAATGMRYSSPRVSNAHSTRAFLLANATVAMFGPRRSLSVTTQRLHGSRLRRACRRVVGRRGSVMCADSGRRVC